MVIAQTLAGALLGGLEWRPALNGKHSARAVHELAGMDRRWTHYARAEANGSTLYGLVDFERVRPPQRALSAASCFANLVGQKAPNAALVLPVPPGPGDAREEARVLVVVLEDGVPSIDAVLSEAVARDAIGPEERPVWAVDQATYPDCEVIDPEWLVQGASVLAQVRKVPRNPWPALVLAGLVVLGALIAWGYGNVPESKGAEAPFSEGAHGR